MIEKTYNQQNPLISVITASYNYASLISETIQSVLNQTYTNWELIIVDDGSNDNSVEVIKEFCLKDSRIHFFQHEGGVNRGLAETIKLGMQKACGEWIAFLESDDMFEANCLEEKVKIINEHPDVKFIFSDLITFGDENAAINKKKLHDKITKHLRKKKCNPFDLRHDLVWQNYVSSFSIVMTKKDLLKTCDFNTPVGAYLDYWLWTQMAQKTKFYYLDKKLTRWRVHKDSYINKISNKHIFFSDCIRQFYSKDFWGRFNFSLKRLKEKKQKIISIKTGKNSHLIIFGLNILSNKKDC